MKVILREEVTALGKAGEVKTVSDGYARNFLIPRGLAELATEKNLETLSQRLAASTAAHAKERAGFQALSDMLTRETLRFTLKANKRGQAFGSITAKDIVGTLASRGVKIERNWVHLRQPIKTLGEHSLDIQLPQGIATSVRIVVAPEPETKTGTEPKP